MMPNDLYSSRPWPTLWAEGTLFAFSGYDGSTCAVSGMVATLHDRPGTLLIHTPRRRVLDLGWPDDPSDDGVDLDAITGDVLVGRGFRVTWSAWHTLMGDLPDGVTPTLTVEGAEAPIAPGSHGVCVSVDEHDALVLVVREGRFALAYGENLDEADHRAAQGIRQQAENLIPQRLAFFNRVPTREPPADEALSIKLASVMKVNTLAPEGPFTSRWSTPDRVPHRDLWLWDSAFHAIGMNHLDAELAGEFLEAAVLTQQPDGLIPHQTAPTGWQSPITQPPVLAWGCWENYAVTGDAARLARMLPGLLSYLEWDLKHRDRNDNGLLEWAPTDHHPGCESGMDNSPRFDRAPVDAVDFTTFFVHDLRYVARIAEVVGDEARQRRATTLADDAAARLHEHLWDEELGLYGDRDASGGELSPTRAVSDFFPLLLKDLPEERVDRITAWLLDSDHFASTYAIPSVSLADPAWGTDMWRGASWVNANYIVIVGLRRHGRQVLADQLARRTLAMVRDGIDRFGVTFEFYDAAGQVDPVDLERKGPRRRPYNLRHKMDSIRDYHWTAALALDLLLRPSA
jgi:hypothetical protein